ncbi:nitrate- and nitrite sensing domain-containing protein [Cellulosimicrobium terreum]|nr:nitrate- and nitrite sensing domain-containing protein [Cellulosimicrobium terreum]
MSVRGKILAALAVPVLVLFAAAAIISGQAISSARASSQTSALVAALAAQDSAGTEIAAERTLAILDANRVDGAHEMMLEQREKTDKALDRRDAQYEALSTSALDDRVQKSISDTIADREVLENTRTGIDQSVLRELQRTSYYTNLIDSALDVPRTLADTTQDRELAQYLDAYVQLDELLAQQALELPVGGGVLAAAQVGQSNISDNQRAATLMTAGDSMVQETSAAVRNLPGDAILTPAGATYVQMRANIAGARPESVPASLAAEWERLSTEDRENTLPVRDQVRNQTETEAAAIATAATTRAVVTIALTLAAVVVSILVAGLIARAIVNPLRRLTDAAEDVRDQLPKLVQQVAVPGQGPGIDISPIVVESTDEVGQLATAFNDVNSTTITVAREQAALRGSIAEMFVNVARRDQVLLNRQLAFLDDLERSEEDPGTLSNLFRLDHLATRMRRNAESLLVLAGIDSGRRVRQPMPASDVIRTASSEIELYDRVRLNLVVDPLMLGHNALNAAHLLAELLENATMFSEPHSPVEVTTGRDDRFVTVTVRDHGLGMTAEETSEANRKVATSAASDVVGAQRLGLFVVGRLADRLGAQVRFTTVGEGAGTEVVVSFPAVLFVPDSNVPLPQPTDPLEVATQEAALQIGSGAADPVQTPSGVVPVTQPGAVVRPAPATADTPVTPEPPLAVPVDLDALTDGTTETGMPRRRPRTVDPAASAPSASLASRPETGAIVLPPLATPALPVDLPAGDDSWSPPADVAAPGGALPSRSRPAPAAQSTDSAEIPVLDVSTRSALFSSFRPMGDQTASENPVDLGVAPDVTATDLPAVGDDHALTESVPAEVWAPEQPAEAEWAPQAADPAAAQSWQPEQPAAQAWEPEQPAAQAWEREQPAAQAWEPATSAFDDATRVVPQVEDPPVPVAAPHADVPVVGDEPVAPGRTDEQAVPAELTFEALPRFEELMADLPTRRSLRESQTRKRGLFGRRPRPTSDRPVTSVVYAVDPQTSAPVDRPAPEPTRPVTQAEAPAAAPALPNRASAFGQRPTDRPAAVSPEPVTDASPFAPQSASGTPFTVAPVVREPVAPPVRVAPPVQAAPVQAPAQAAPAPAAPVGPAAASSPGYGPPAPLVRRRAQEPLEPLEPGYISDSVEARSDWMASAVLYEEMSTLLQGSNDFQEATLADPNDGTYQPLTVESTPNGLTRRSRAGDREGYVDRFTARIDRDPEQLRARLSAFQSATARGRVEVQDDTSSTWTPQSVDYVPDSAAPQAR